MSTVVRILVVTEGKLRPDRGADGIGAMLDVVDSWTTRYFDRFRIQRIQLNEDDGWFNLLDAFAPDAYDQIWFFGSSSEKEPNPAAQARPLSDREIEALRLFMDAGGGVFATGDHADVGALLCGSIPRVRHMRSWGAPGITPAKYKQNRAETVFMSRFTGKDDSEDDAIGKPIWVKYKNSYEPHDLLRGRDSSWAIRWLPDHMHEGKCTSLPSPFTVEVAEDFPVGAQVEIVAWSVKRGFSDPNGLVEGEPFIHDVVGCYDGHKHNQGRVVVDSTFHHWVQGNTQEMLKTVVAPELECYPRNIAMWLSKATKTPAVQQKALLALGSEEKIKQIRAVCEVPNKDYYRDLGMAAEQLWVAQGLNESQLREFLAQQSVPKDARSEDFLMKSAEFAGAKSVDTWEYTGELFDRFLGR